MTWDRFCKLCGIVGAALAVLTLLSLDGCATVKADAKAVAEVCTPQLAGDVASIAPYVLVYVGCEIAHGDCTAALNDIKAAGTAAAVQCALAEAHAAVVKLAADAGAP